MKKYVFVFVISFLSIIYLTPTNNLFAAKVPQRAQVYFIQPKTVIQPTYLFANNQFLAVLKKNSYFLANFNPGINIIEFSEGKKIDFFNVFEFVPGQTYYIAVDYSGYHSILSEKEGVKLLESVQTPVTLNEKAEKRGFKILEKSANNDEESRLKNLLGSPVNINNDPQNVKVPQNAPIKLSFMDELFSENTTDKIVQFQVLDDVYIGDLMCISKGTPVKGEFIRLLPAIGFGEPGFIDIIVREIETNEGIHIPVIGRYTRSGVSGERKTKYIKAAGFLTLCLGSPKGLDYIFLEVLIGTGINSRIKGENVMIPIGEEFIVWTRCDIN